MLKEKNPWVSDGTETGTLLLNDIPGYRPYADPDQFVSVNSMTYFIVNANNWASAIWKTDGTPDGTFLVIDLATVPDEFKGWINIATAANGLVFFSAYTPEAGRELWRTDGTDGGTFMVKDIGPDNSDYFAPMQLTAYDNNLYFSADDGSGRKLWHSDGTEAGTSAILNAPNMLMQTDYLQYTAAAPLPVAGNVLYLPGYTIEDGGGLFKYDAANANGIMLVKDISATTDVNFVVPVDIHAVNDVVYFKVISSTGNWHDEVWKSGGEAASTGPIIIYEPGKISYNFYNAGGTLYFNLYDNVGSGRELWTTDGTTQGTSMVKDINPGLDDSSPYYLTFCRGKLLFSAFDKNHGTELWSSDGTAAGTSLVKDINAYSTNSSNAGGYGPYEMVSFKNGVVFSAYTPDYGYELYKSDGKSSNTVLVKDVLQGGESSYPNGFITKNGVAYFRANNTNTDWGFQGSAIYKTDGTAAGTKKIVDVNGAYFFSYNVADNGVVFYLLYNLSTYTTEAWRSDGTATGTFLIASNVYWNYYSNPYLAVADNKAFFVAGNYDIGYELWGSNGTVAGTSMVKDINPGPGSSDPYSLFAYNNEVYFGAYDGIGYYSFWKTDGTAKGTTRLSNLTPAYGYDVYYTSLLYCVSNNNLYVSGIDYNANPYVGSELYKTNGTPQGTKLVKDINTYYDSYPYQLTDVNGTLFFMADDGIHGYELWKTNGTEPGTKLVKDISPDWFYTDVINLTSAGGKLFFIKDKYYGGAIWSSDGTAANTNPVQDDVFNNLYSIRNLTGSGDKLFFGAWSYQYGAELYVGDVSDSKGNISMAAASKIPEAITDAFDASLYPNPARQNATLQLTGNEKNVLVSVTDISGKMIWNNQFNNQRTINLPVNRWTAGIYMVTIRTSKENKTIKFVKQ